MASKKNGAIAKMVEQNPDVYLDALLEQPFWPNSLRTEVNYARRSDDTDGEDKYISVGFSRDGDGWIEIASHGTEDDPSPVHRFRTWGGGGRSLRVLNALLILARAIDLDSKERPDPPRAT